MSGHEWWMVGGGLVVVLWVAAAVYVALWPWFILAAMRRMAVAQQALADALTNGEGGRDVSESMAYLSLNVARMADAMHDQAKALQDLAVAMKGVAEGKPQPDS